MNSTLKTTVLLFFFSFLLQDYCCGQTNTGRLTFNGRGEANTIFVEKTEDPYGLLEAELGYVFFDRFLGLAEFRLETFNDLRLFRYGYGARYSFVRMMPIEIYGGLKYEHTVTSVMTVRFIDGVISDFRKRQVRKEVSALFGSYYFLNSTVAIDAQVKLPIYSSNSGVELHLGLQYFFDPKAKSKMVDRRDSSFAKKRMLSLSLDISESLSLGLYDRIRGISLASDFGYVLGRRGMIGVRTRFIYQREGFPNSDLVKVEISPFGRFYFLALKKSKLYFEGQLYVNALSFESQISSMEREKTMFLDAHLGFGWSRKINENLRLDFFTGIKLYQYYSEESRPDRDYKEGDRLLKTRIGIERYF